MNITRQKGCKDILPDESILWQYIENEIKEICRVHNIQEIRTPVFEATELYARGVGDETDIVTKEMYTFLDKGIPIATLKEEGVSTKGKNRGIGLFHVKEIVSNYQNVLWDMEVKHNYFIQTLTITETF